jgi:hypothetical protein
VGYAFLALRAKDLALPHIQFFRSVQRHSRHFVPGYYQSVPPGQKPFVRRLTL